MSGIEIDSEITELYNDMKLRSTNKWATFKIEKKKKIVLDQKADPMATEDKDVDKECFVALKAALTNEPRYILYDFGFINKEGRKIKKLAFIFWYVLGVFWTWQLFTS